MPTAKALNQKSKESTPKAKVLPPLTSGELSGISVALDLAKANVAPQGQKLNYIPILMPTVISAHQLGFLMENSGVNGVLYYGVMVTRDSLVVFGECQIKEKYYFNLIDGIRSDSKKVTIGVSQNPRDFTVAHSGLLKHSSTSYFNCQPGVKLIPYDKYRACRVEGVRDFPECEASIQNHPNFAAGEGNVLGISFEGGSILSATATSATATAPASAASAAAYVPGSAASPTAATLSASTSSLAPSSTPTSRNQSTATAAAPVLLSKGNQGLSKQDQDMLNQRKIAKENFDKVVKLLNDVRLPSDAENLPKPELALRRAASDGKIEVVKDLIAFVMDIDVGATGPSNRTALDYATKNKKTEVITFLSNLKDKTPAKNNTAGEEEPDNAETSCRVM